MVSPTLQTTRPITPLSPEADTVLKENAYGHARRLHWILERVRPDETLIELGCGTGVMISLPLQKLGYGAHGVDLDDASVRLGQEIYAKEGVNPEVLQTVDIADSPLQPDVVIASEVMEHIPDRELAIVLDVIRAKLPANGRLLVTVPNGYGWFELESFLWFKAGIGRLLEVLRVVRVVNLIKGTFCGRDLDYPYPSTIAHSPHVQRFTLRSIQNLLTSHGFEITEATGSVLFAGPFSNLFFTGVKPLMRLNNWLGSRLPRFASGFYVAARVADNAAGKRS